MLRHPVRSSLLRKAQRCLQLTDLAFFDQPVALTSFPELHTILTRKGATVISIPSAFTLKTGKDHWATLLKSIAIVYQGADASYPATGLLRYRD